MKTSRKTFHRFQSSVNPRCSPRGEHGSINHFSNNESLPFPSKSYPFFTRHLNRLRLIGHGHGHGRYQFRVRVYKTAGFQGVNFRRLLFARHSFWPRHGVGYNWPRPMPATINGRMKPWMDRVYNIIKRGGGNNMKSNPAKRPSRRRVVRARASSNGTRSVLPLFRFYYTFYDSPRPRFSTFCRLASDRFVSSKWFSTVEFYRAHISIALYMAYQGNVIKWIKIETS